MKNVSHTSIALHVRYHRPSQNICLARGARPPHKALLSARFREPFSGGFCEAAGTRHGARPRTGGAAELPRDDRPAGGRPLAAQLARAGELPIVERPRAAETNAARAAHGEPFADAFSG